MPRNRAPPIDIQATRGPSPEKSPFTPFSFITVDNAKRMLCFLARSLPASASMILVFATSRGVVNPPPIQPTLIELYNWYRPGQDNLQFSL